MQPSNAEVRAGAVAKLKRATSLPRIKGGRRPPMPPDDLEKPAELPETNNSQDTSQNSSPNTSNDADLPLQTLPPHPHQHSNPQSSPPSPPASTTAAQLPPPDQEEVQGGHDPPDEPNNDDEPNGQSFSPPPTPTKRKRRSRSRTRTRSKDFKSKTPPPLEESSPEAKHSFLPTDDDIPLPSTIPSRPSPLPPGTRLPLPFTPPTAPSTPVPFGVGVPTLQDIQQMVGAGLFRSQSARANAMIKLIGGMDSTMPTLPLSNSISRSNTVTGTTSDTEQRAAARQRMMGRLKNRVGGNQTDDLTTSGGEDGPITPKKKRRRSRKSSNPAPAPVNGSSVIDDRDDRDGSISTTDTNPACASPDTGPSSRHLTPTPQMPPDMLPSIPFFSYQPPQPQLHNTLLPLQAPSPPPESEEPQPMQQPTPPSHTLPQWTFQLDSPPLPRRKHDDVVIEEDDPSVGSDAPRSPSPLPHPNLQDESLNTNGINGRLPHTSDAPSTMSAFSGQDISVIMTADIVPLPYRQDFPKTPFTTPLTEHLSRDEEEEEEIVVWHEKNVNGSRSNERMNVATAPASSSNIIETSTSESLLPPESMSDVRLQPSPAPPFSSEDDEFPLSAPSRQLAPSPQDLRATSPSPVGRDMYPPAPSPSSAVALSQTTNTRESASSLEPMGGIGNFSNATGIFKRESYTDVGTDYEDVHTDKETTKEKMGWASKLKKTLVERSGSITGRRSRANSTTKRESATSGVSKVEVYKYDHPSTAPPSAWSSPTLPYSQLTESSRTQPSGQVTVPASSSMHSFMPVSPHRRGQSPIPPASPAEMSKYGANDKLAPFPGLLKLDEERRRQQQRTRRMSMSSPNLPGDVAAAAAAEAVLHTDNEIEVEKRERKLSHQYSDTGLLQKFRNPDSESISPTSPSTPHTAPLNGTSHKSGTLGSSWLPMSRNDLRKWYKANKINNSTPSPKITTAIISPPVTPSDKLELPTSRPGSRQQKFTDIFHQNKRNNNGSPTDFEDMSNPSTTPKSSHVKMRLDSSDIADLSHDSYVGRQASPSSAQDSMAMRMRSQQQVSISSSTDSYYKRENETDGEGIASAPKASTSFSRPALSIIPEPLPSDRSWTPSASQTDSSLSYKPSESPETPSHPPERSSVVMQRLDSLLSREPSIQPIWSFLDEPPRKLIMSSSVTQIVDSETSRERFLFLFNDILVLAKPLEPTVMAMDRSFVVKNVIDLNTVQVIPNRRLSSIGMRHPFVQQFVRDFNENPDLAVANLLQSTGLEDDPVALGKLLFNTIELDRTRLGAYLTKKAKRTVLRTYIDCFGLAGIRIDQALRAFALTLRFPPDLPEHSLEHVLNMFAGRWFDANAKSVSHGKDLAMKLVRILVHLDNQLQKSMRVPHQAGYRDFSAEWEAMVRAVDPRGILPDDSIQDMYYSLWNNPIRWAADSQYRNQNITFKRAPPNHLVYRIQSDPITIRIQQPDPHLRIQLLSQDGLVFDPPELNFARSTEAAFRVTGSSLGPKSIIFSLLGPHAPFYRGLPYSKTIVVERSFMRNTFQIAFKDPDGSKRRYMFSTDDAVVCNQYMMNVQPPQPTPIKSSHNDLDLEMAEAQKAAKALSLTILREALSEKLSGHDLILICKQNSLVASVLPSVTSVSNLYSQSQFQYG